MPWLHRTAPDCPARAVAVQHLHLLARACKLPCNSLARKGFVEWEEWGGPRIADTGVSCQAALLRAARYTFDGWQEMTRMLDLASEDTLNAPSG